MALRGKKLSAKEPARLRPCHWPEWELLAPEGPLAIPEDGRPRVSLEELKNAAKSAYRRLGEHDDAAEIATILREFDLLLRAYLEGKVRASLRQFEETSTRYAKAPPQALPLLTPSSELLRYAEEEPELEGLLNTLYRPLLEKRDLLNLADFFGKQLFLRLQNRQSLYAVELTELLQTEKILAAQGPALPGQESIWQGCQLALAGREEPRLGAEANFLQKAAAAAEGSFFHRPPAPPPTQTQEGRFRHLLSLRRELALQLRLPDFKSLAFLRAERFDEHSEDLNDFLKRLRMFFLPLAIEIRRDWAETEGLSAERVFESAGRLVPPVERLAALEAAPQDFAFFSDFIDQILKPSAPHFFLRLHEKSLLKLRPAAADEAPWADCAILPESELPYIFGRLSLCAEDLPLLLNAAGRAYACLCNYKDRSFEVMRQPPADLLELWGEGLYFLALEFMPRLFTEENEGRRYRHLLLGQSVQRLCHQAMLFEFETELAALERKGRDGCERLWTALVRRYYPDAAERSVWLRSQRETYADSAQLWQQPFSSFGRLRALMSGLSLWDLSRGYRAESVNRYETLCTLGSSDTPKLMLAQARFPDPWSESAVKRLVYQLAFALGY